VEKPRDIAVGDNGARLARQMPAHIRSDLLKQTLAEEHTMALATERDSNFGNPFLYCVGSQCVDVVVSLNVPGAVAGPKVMVSACKSQNSALICVPLRCGPLVITPPPPTGRFFMYGGAAARLVHAAMSVGSPLYLGATKMVEDGETTFVMLPFIKSYMF
jgi:hypothetical protein